MIVQFKLEGPLISDLRSALETDLPQKIRAEVSKTANDVLRMAKNSTPRGKTGKALAGWERSPMRVNKAGGSVRISNKAKYAKFLEGGGSKRAPKGMLNPALKRNSKVLDNRVEQAAQEVFDSL